jgi:hypothetical protein
MMFATLRWIGLLAGLLFSLPAQGAEFRIDSATNEQLVLDMPAGWRGFTANPEGAAVTTLAFSPAQGASFRMLVTLIPLPRDASRPPITASDLRESTQAAADQARSRSVEAVLTVQSLTGPQVSGVYFQATDRAPPAGEFKHLTQGSLVVGEAVLTFTVLANDDAPGGPEAVRRQALAALAAIRVASR